MLGGVRLVTRQSRVCQARFANEREQAATSEALLRSSTAWPAEAHVCERIISP